jgi:nucleotide-binding universal stress UspA family protein
MDTVLVGVVGTESGGRALARAAEIAEAFRARLVVVSVTGAAPMTVREPVVDPVGPLLLAPTAAGPAAVVRPPAVVQEQEPSHQELDQARAYLVNRKLDVEYVTEIGDPVDRLLEVAEEHDADLIVVGNPEHGFLERLLGRPVEEALARRAHRDVLLVS